MDLSRLLLSALALPLALTLTACAGRHSPLEDLSKVQLEAMLDGGQVQPTAQWQETWQILSLKLQNDGLDAQKTRALFSGLTTQPSRTPMQAKVKELYTSKWIPVPPAKSTADKPSSTKATKSPAMELGVPGPWFKGVVTEANALRCRDFIRTHDRAFYEAQRRYGVPQEVGAALLFVETRLGTYLGKNDAFHMLAGMAVTRMPELIPETVAALPDAHIRLPWIREKMQVKADWAYDELKALLTHCFANGLDPLSLKGSIYGAVGLCQFMPSNLPRYAADGDGDGVIDVFVPADAIASLSRYLMEHGWKPGLPLDRQAKVLRSYNNMTIYANTILALAETIRRLP